MNADELTNVPTSVLVERTVTLAGTVKLPPTTAHVGHSRSVGGVRPLPRRSM